MNICGVCVENTAKYKCPTCKIPFCSTGCCKTHKTSGCGPPDAEPKEAKTEKSETTYNYPTDDTVHVDKLKLLHQSDELKYCLKNPHVRDIMNGVLNARDPTDAIAQAMTEPIFVEMADACLKVVEPPDEKEPC